MRRGASQEYQWRLVNGLWSVLLSLGLLYTAWELHHARRWTLGPPWFRSLCADYGVVSMVWLWTGISYSVKRTPPGTVRRLVLPDTWSYYSFWTVAGVKPCESCFSVMAGVCLPPCQQRMRQGLLRVTEFTGSRRNAPELAHQECNNNRATCLPVYCSCRVGAWAHAAAWSALPAMQCARLAMPHPAAQSCLIRHIVSACRTWVCCRASGSRGPWFPPSSL